MSFSGRNAKRVRTPGLAATITAVCAIVLASLLIPQLAYGHAVPVSYSIEPNSIFDDPGSVPSTVSISFSERPDPRTSYIRVLDAQNERIDNNDFTISTTSAREAFVTIDTEKLQDDSIYSISWRTLSLDDGHITEGAYVFGTGDIGDIGTGAGQETRYVTSTLDALFKWPLIVAQTALVGGAFAHLFLWRPFLSARENDNVQSGAGNVKGSSNDNSNSNKRLAIIFIASSAAVMGMATALLLVQASNLATSEDSDYFSIFQSLISGSPSGSVWMLRMATSAAVIALAAGLYALARKGRRPAPFVIISAAILVVGGASIFSNSMLSHNSAAPVYPELAVFADWLHFMAVSAWVGGLFYFSAVGMKRISDAGNGDPVEVNRLLSLFLPRFSVLASISLGIIGITGIYMAWIHIHDFEFLFQTTYGTSLIVKLSAAVPMVVLGGYHQLILHRNMVILAGGKGNGIEGDAARKKDAAASRFAKTVKIESIIGVGVLLAASFLTITSPPSQEHHHQVVDGSGYSQTVQVDDTEVTFRISPYQVGVNTFTVQLRNEAGQAPANVQNVFMRFTNTQAGIGPIITTLEEAGAGSYSVSGAFLSQQGTWRFDFIAQRTDAYDLNHSFEENLEAGGETHSGHGQQPGAEEQPADSTDEEVSTMAPSETFTIAAIVLSIGIAGVSAYSTIKSKRQLRQTVENLGKGSVS